MTNSSQTAPRSKNAVKSSEDPLKGPESGFYVRFGMVAEAKVDVDSERLAIEVVKAVAKRDLKKLLLMIDADVLKFQVVGSGALGLAQTVDVRAKEGTTQNKLCLKRATALNPPANVEDEKIKKLIEWFGEESNVHWAKAEHVEWANRYTEWFKNRGFLTKKQYRSFEGTKAKVQYRNRTYGRRQAEKIWQMYRDDGEQIKAAEYYKKHLKKYDKT